MSDRVRVNRICEITGLSKRQVQALSANGTIPSAAQLGKLWTYREDVVKRWIMYYFMVRPD
jgi:phage terminase Nu1 subunit (DNA packaging protein)